VKWDLIILDEGQRIKNWEAKTSQVIKALRSPYALSSPGPLLKIAWMSSTPWWNLSMTAASARRSTFTTGTGSSMKKGGSWGTKNLDDLRERLKPVLLRRTRKMVMEELPPRATEIRRIPPTDEQISLHNAQLRIIRKILAKRYLTEMDILRLQKALLICRMAANSTYLVR